jgi:hypothetical protein
VLLDGSDKDYGVIHRSLTTPKGKARLCYGGSVMLAEYAKSTDVLKLVSALDRAGRAQKWPDSAVDTEAAKIKAKGQLTSNDEHVLGLGVISGARVLCTQDAALIADWKNPSIINNPRGSVFSKSSHLSLLQRLC